MEVKECGGGVREDFAKRNPFHQNISTALVLSLFTILTHPSPRQVSWGKRVEEVATVVSSRERHHRGFFGREDLGGDGATVSAESGLLEIGGFASEFLHECRSVAGARLSHRMSHP
jgi:hypothetical protein